MDSISNTGMEYLDSLGWCQFSILKKKRTFHSSKSSIFPIAGILRIMRFKSKGNCQNEGKTEDLELPLYDIDVIVNATGNFSAQNKLGEGGFGPVYKV